MTTQALTLTVPRHGRPPDPPKLATDANRSRGLQRSWKKTERCRRRCVKDADGKKTNHQKSACSYRLISDRFGSALTNDKGQSIYYGKVGGCVITGNEDGIKHTAMTIGFTLNHLGYTTPPQADCGWIGEAGPGPSYGDEIDGGGRVGFDNDFTQRNTTIMTWNCMHLARMLKQAGGIPNEGNDRKAWKAGERFGFENPDATAG